jgi:hypothetical protein
MQVKPKEGESRVVYRPGDVTTGWFLFVVEAWRSSRER